MPDDWFYAQQGRQLGPVSFHTLASLLRTGQLSPADLVWRQGMPNWLAARSIPDLAPHIPPAPSPAPLIPPPPDSPFEVQYQNPRNMQWENAGFFLRFVAWLIDYFLLLIPTIGIARATGFALALPVFRPGLTTWKLFAVGGSHNMLTLVIWWLYYALFESSTYQATPGKMALGLIVTDEAGNRLSFARATARTFSKYISWLTLGIGYLLIAFTSQKQALHDLIARTLVARKDVNRA